MAEFTDPYLDPVTGILRNLVGARNQAELDQAEGDLTFGRAVELLDQPPRPSGDLDEMQAIHRQLFEDIYGWAGQIRTVDIRKNTGNAEIFLPASFINRPSVFAADELRQDDMLRHMSHDQFVGGWRITTINSTICTPSAKAMAAHNAPFGSVLHATPAGSWTGNRSKAR